MSQYPDTEHNFAFTIFINPSHLIINFVSFRNINLDVQDFLFTLFVNFIYFLQSLIILILSLMTILVYDY